MDKCCVRIFKLEIQVADYARLRFCRFSCLFRISGSKGNEICRDFAFMLLFADKFGGKGNDICTDCVFMLLLEDKSEEKGNEIY